MQIIIAFKLKEQLPFKRVFSDSLVSKIKILKNLFLVNIRLLWMNVFRRACLFTTLQLDLSYLIGNVDLTTILACPLWNDSQDDVHHSVQGYISPIVFYILLGRRAGYSVSKCHCCNWWIQPLPVVKGMQEPSRKRYVLSNKDFVVSYFLTFLKVDVKKEPSWLIMWPQQRPSKRWHV